MCTVVSPFVSVEGVPGIVIKVLHVPLRWVGKFVCLCIHYSVFAYATSHLNWDEYMPQVDVCNRHATSLLLHFLKGSISVQLWSVWLYMHIQLCTVNSRFFLFPSPIIIDVSSFCVCMHACPLPEGERRVGFSVKNLPLKWVFSTVCTAYWLGQYV